MDAVPFEFPAPGLPHTIMEASVDGGAPMRVLFDTGNATPYAVVVSRKLARTGAAPLSGAPALETKAVAGGPGARFEPASLRSFRLGPIELRQPSAAVSDAIDAVSTQLPGGIDALIGYEFARWSVLSIDYPTRRIDFDALRPTSAGTPFTLAPHRPLILVKASVNGKPLTLVLDSGAGASVLSRAAAERVGVKTDGPGVMLGGAGGTGSPGWLSQGDVTVGGRTWAGKRLVVSDLVLPVAAEAGGGIDGLLGADLFVDGRLTVDYPGNRFWFEPAPAQAQAKASASE